MLSEIELTLINRRIEAETGSRFDGQLQPGPGGGCIHQTRCLHDFARNQKYFLKLNGRQAGEMFAAEARGLVALAAINCVRVPLPVVWGETGAHAFLVLEWLDLQGGNPRAWARFGTQLAHLHSCVQEGGFGFQQHNFIGSTRQINTPAHNWTIFFGEHRLGFQIQLAQKKGAHLPLAESLLMELPDRLGGHQPQAALLHGDLWSGNCGFLADGRPVIFDPACYRGDSEADMAMTHLFGGFPATFYRAYDAFRPPLPGSAWRLKLYNLYHVLNHYNLFGGAYQMQAHELMAELL